MSEFSIIERFCTGLGRPHESTIIGVGDDAAVVQVPADMSLAVSVDSMVEGVHFLPNSTPDDLAYKLLAVNLSDMAAMGATPQWATVTLTLPQHDEAWLAAFSSSLHHVAEHYGVHIIGGDTTQGPLNLSINIMGLLPKSKALTRSGAAPGDVVYVSNTLGDAALALSALQGAVVLSTQQTQAVLPALHRPSPQLSLGQRLLGLASACLDVSDGLVGDLGHIAAQSGVSFELEIDAVPLSETYQAYRNSGGDLALALSGGDDYQLAFTAHPQATAALDALASDIGVRITPIGMAVAQRDVPITLLQDGQAVTLADFCAYQHFS